jgi:hypothetical protein
MVILIGAMLLVAGVVMCVEAAAGSAAARRTRWWARHAHDHRWKAIRTAYGPEDTTTVIEECRLCPALQARILAGAWMLNRLEELSPVELVSEAETFQRMMR